MTIRIGINGFGRIGRLFYRQVVRAGGFEIAAINDLVPADCLAYLVRYDTAHGRFEHDVSVQGEDFHCNGMVTRCLSERDPADLVEGALEAAPAKAPSLKAQQPHRFIRVAAGVVASWPRRRAAPRRAACHLAQGSGSQRAC